MVCDCAYAVMLSWPRTWTRCVLATEKLDANIEAVILRQSVQWQRKVLTRPGPEVGKESWTAPQKQVAVAEEAFDQPSEATPARGK